MPCNVGYLVVVMELSFGIDQYGSNVLFGESADTSSSNPERVIMLNDLEGAIVSDHYPAWWTHRTGGCTGGMELTEDNPHGGKRCGSFYFDTSRDNGYVATELRQVWPPRCRELRFWVRAPGDARLSIRIVDSTGQEHQTKLCVKKGLWKHITVNLTKPLPEHWKGKNDGIIHQPIKGVQFLRECGSNPKVGTIYIDDIEVVTTAFPRELIDWFWSGKRSKIALETGHPGNLYYPDDPVHARVVAMLRPPKELELKVAVKVFDVEKRKVAEFPSLSLSHENGFAAPLNLPRDLGFYYVEFTVSDGKHSETVESRYAVIPPNPTMDRKEPKSPFGVNTHFNQWNQARLGSIVKRAGIAWIRDCEANLNDQAMPVPNANNLCYMPCFTYWTGHITKRMKEAIARGETVGKDWDFSEAVEWHRQYAEKYGADIDVYDLMNEPHEGWGGVLGGGWRGGEWLKMFAVYGRQVTDAIQGADLGAQVLWEDIDQLLWYKEWGKLGVAEKIAYISPHSYNLHRNTPLPEEQFILARNQFPPFREFCRQHKLPWKVWAGEVGFSSFSGPLDKVSTLYYTPCTEAEQANLLVRMMFLQLYEDMEKILKKTLRLILRLGQAGQAMYKVRKIRRQ